MVLFLGALGVVAVEILANLDAVIREARNGKRHHLNVGIALLATLMLAVTVNDVMRIWDGFLKYIHSIASIFL